MGTQWDVPDWEEPEESWTMLDEAQRWALPVLNRSRREPVRAAMYALVRTLAAPLTAARLRSAGWQRQRPGSWVPAGSRSARRRRWRISSGS